MHQLCTFGLMVAVSKQMVRGRGVRYRRNRSSLWVVLSYGVKLVEANWNDLPHITLLNINRQNNLDNANWQFLCTPFDEV